MTGTWSPQAWEHVATLLPGVELGDADDLGGGARSTVHRVRTTGADGAPGSVVVKWFHDAGEGWVRETAALTCVPEAMGLPRVIAASVEPPVAVLSDLGRGATLADALLGDDADEARRALVLWAQTMARLHVATRGLRATFQRALDARAADLPVYDEHIGTDIDDAVRALEHECGALGVAVPAGAFDEFRGLHERLGGDGSAALTPADACPNNNVERDGRLVPFDFESGQWRHVAWDVAYLTVPWPTCWCSWRLPEDAADAAIDAYVAVAREAFPLVAQPAFRADVEAASVGWAYLSVAAFLASALDSDQPRTGGERTSPTKRAVVLHRLRLAERAMQLPALAQLARHLRQDLEQRWGPVPLELAPAFRGSGSRDQ